MLVVIDAGNTRIKFGAFRGDILIATEEIEGGGPDGSAPLAAGLVPFAHVAAADRIVIVSSAPAALPALLGVLPGQPRVLGDDVRRALRTSYTDARELGIDRIAAAYGAVRAVSGGSVIVVDAGTCTTVDAVDESGAFVAVAIAPGLAAGRAGLRRAAPHLPAVPHGEPPRVPARGTAESLGNGLLLGAAGAVERLVAAARRVIGPAPVVLTGGAAPELLPLLSPDVIHAPHAVLHGARILNDRVSA